MNLMKVPAKRFPIIDFNRPDFGDAWNGVGAQNGWYPLV